MNSQSIVLSPAHRSQSHQCQALYRPPDRSRQSQVLAECRSHWTTGRTILLSSAEAEAYDLHITRFANEYNPDSGRERELVQSLADTQWRLNRIPSLEAGIFASGRIQFADLFSEHEPAVRDLLIQNHVFVTYRRELNNLSIQESRLRRNFTKDSAELAALQTNRQELAKASQPCKLPLNGFEFSTTAPADSEPQAHRDSQPASMMYLHANSRISPSADLS